MRAEYSIKGSTTEGGMKMKKFLCALVIAGSLGIFPSYATVNSGQESDTN